MSQPNAIQKQMITMMFAKKTQGKKAQDKSDMAAVAIRRRIETLEEQKRLEQDYAF